MNPPKLWLPIVVEHTRQPIKALYYETVTDKAAYDDQVQTQAAYDETVATGYVCSTCGATK